MNIDLQQAATILNRSIDEVLYIANVEKRLPIKIILDEDMVYNEDGTISFKTDELSDPQWAFDLEDVLEFKKEMDAGLAGEVQELLEG